MQVNIIFALPDYSSEVIERRQNLFYGRLINLALEFDIHLTTGENRSKGKIGRNLTLYKTTITIMQGYRRSRKEFSWSRCTVDNVCVCCVFFPFILDIYW